MKEKDIGFLFDMDGFLFNTQTSFHAKAESIVCSEHNVIVLPEEISKRFAGISTKQVFTELVPGCNPEELNSRKWDIMREMLETEQLELLSGIAFMCHTLHARNMPFAIASASPRWWIEKCLSKQVSFSSSVFSAEYSPDAKTLGYYFNTRYVSAEECDKGKPAPDVFLKAKKLLEDETGPRSRWIVAGDGRSDVYAGIAAGMEVIYLAGDDSLFNAHTKVTSWRTSEMVVKQVLRLIEHV